MLKNKRGIIGFMLTMALGVAVGAATLVVGNEIVRGQKKKNQNSTGTNQTLIDSTYREYDRAQRAYYKAIAEQSPDLVLRKEEFIKAKGAYELAILGNFPGAKPMLSNLSVSPAKEGSENRTNPFDSRNVITGVKGIQTLPSGNSRKNLELSAPQDSKNVLSKPTPPTSSTPSDHISLEYYRAKKGDTLWEISQRYYGEGGMWTHILKYQIPSIAANPGLIFPGQLIVLPRNFSQSGGFSAPPTQPSGSQPPTSPPLQPPASSQNSDESWQTSFQKDYLISDATLTNSNTMTVSQIQSFLEKKGSVLSKPYNNSSPAQMIFNAAKKHGINPQVILTRLQVEQGLVSKKTATQKQLDWALGVGAYDGGNWNKNFKGFDKQVEGAAATYKKHYLAAKAKLDRGEKITMKIDGQNVLVKNAATYASYKYTPHFNGSRLFYDVWRGYKKYW